MKNYNTYKNKEQKQKERNSSEKHKSFITASALAWSTRCAISKEKYLSSNNLYKDTLTKFLNKRNIEHNTNIEFLKWSKNQAVLQKAQLFHLTINLNVMKEGSDDFVFPFSLWPLRSNESFYDASDKELAGKFNKSLNQALIALGIVPEYYYVITGEPNFSDKGNCRHIHGCIRMPAFFYDEHNSTAIKAMYDILKRACGLTETRENQIRKQDKRGAEYKFAIASLNNQRADKNKPFGYMLDIGSPLKVDWSQEHWSEYIISERNQPNNIHRSKKLSIDTVDLNDKLYEAAEKFKSCSQLTANSPLYEGLTRKWIEVIYEHINRKDKMNEESKPLYLSDAQLRQLRDGKERLLKLIDSKSKAPSLEQTETYSPEYIDELLSKL